MCCRVAPLAGLAIGITGHRRSDELAAHLHSLGADVMLGPAVHVRPVTGELEPLRLATADVIERPPGFVVATTGIGIRSWLNAAATWGLRTRLVDALRASHVLARGPKVVGALSEIDVTPWYVGHDGRTDEIVDALCGTDLSGVRVAIVLSGAAAPEVVARLEQVGASVEPIRVYDWNWPEDAAPPRKLARALADGKIDAVTFTSRPAVRNFLALATAEGVHDEVVRAFRGRTAPVCVGGVTATEFELLAGAPATVPSEPVLGMVVQATVDVLQRTRHHHLRTPRGDEVVVQGRLIAAAGTAVTASDREAALLHRLIATPRVTVSRHDLLRSVWHDGADPSVLETTMARLRRRLASTGLTILTITSRGYLLGADVGGCPDSALVDAT